MNYYQFLKNSIRHIRTTGTITRSSRTTCKMMIRNVDFGRGRYFVELGGGDGVMTRYILRAMHPDAKLMTFEINPDFVRALHKIDDPRLIVISDQAQKLPHYLKVHRFPHADAIISSLPLLVIPSDERTAIVQACRKSLRPGGTFSQIHYSPTLKNFYGYIFGNVEMKFVLLNLPPAFIMYCQKNHEHV